MIQEILNRGHSIRFRAPGDSMYPTICHGDVVTVMPIETASISNGDIILYRHRSGVTAHRVMRILRRSEKDSRRALHGHQDRSSSETLEFLLRGDAAITFDDPVCGHQILGKVIWIERKGHCRDPYSLRIKFLYKARRLASHLKKRMRRHCF